MRITRDFSESRGCDRDNPEHRYTRIFVAETQVEMPLLQHQLSITVNPNLVRAWVSWKECETERVLVGRRSAFFGLHCVSL